MSLILGGLTFAFLFLVIVPTIIYPRQAAQTALVVFAVELAFGPSLVFTLLFVSYWVFAFTLFPIAWYVLFALPREFGRQPVAAPAPNVPSAEPDAPLPNYFVKTGALNLRQ